MKAKKVTSLLTAILISSLTLIGCADTNTAKYEDYMLSKLKEKYKMDFEFTDSKYLKMSNSSIANNDLIYGYVHPVTRDIYGCQNFYVETTSACTSTKDSFSAMKIQNQLNTVLSTKLLNVQTSIQYTDEGSLAYERPKLSSLNLYKLPFDVTCIISVDINADLAVDKITKELTELCSKLNEYDYNKNGCLVLFVNPEYEEEVVRYANHDLEIEAKLDQKNVYASVNVDNLEDTEDSIRETIQNVADNLSKLRANK